MDLNALPLDRLFDALTADGLLRALLELARREDLGEAGDVTSTAMISAAATAQARIAARVDGVAAGLAAIPILLQVFDSAAVARVEIHDGEVFRRGDVLLEFTGPKRSLLAVERTLLNLLSRLSGIATMTAR